MKLPIYQTTVAIHDRQCPKINKTIKGTNYSSCMATCGGGLRPTMGEVHGILTPITLSVSISAITSSSLTKSPTARINMWVEKYACVWEWGKHFIKLGSPSFPLVEDWKWLFVRKCWRCGGTWRGMKSWKLEWKVSLNNTLHVYCTHVSATYKQRWNSYRAKITLIDKTGEFVSSDLVRFDW